MISGGSAHVCLIVIKGYYWKQRRAAAITTAEFKFDYGTANQSAR